MPDKPTQTPQQILPVAAVFAQDIPLVRSADLFAGETEILIRHRECTYVLSVLPNGDLHLTEL